MGANYRHLCEGARGEGGPEAELASRDLAACGAPVDPLFGSGISLRGRVTLPYPLPYFALPCPFPCLALPCPSLLTFLFSKRSRHPRGSVNFGAGLEMGGFCEEVIGEDHVKRTGLEMGGFCEKMIGKRHMKKH